MGKVIQGGAGNTGRGRKFRVRQITLGGACRAVDIIKKGKITLK